MAFSFYLFSHLFLTFGHQLSYFLHVEIGNLGLMPNCPNLLNLIREKNGEFWAIKLLTIFTILIVILFIDFLDQFPLH